MVNRDLEVSDVDPAFVRTLEAFAAGIVALSNFVRVDRLLSEQVRSGRVAFFGTAVPDDASPARAKRFLEWFTLERRADGTGGPPVRAFLAAGCPGLEAPATRAHVEALAESEFGVFAIRDTTEDGFELEAAFDDDVDGDFDGRRSSGDAAADAGAGLRRLWLPGSASHLMVGQTIVGRLARVPDSDEDRFCALDALAVFSNLDFYVAIQEEITRRRLEQMRTSAASALELEPLLVAFEEAALERPEVIERDLRAFLGPSLEAAHDASGDPGDDDVAPDEEMPLPRLDELCYALEVAESPGSVIGPVMDALAFRTDADLDHARRLMLRLWNAHRAAALRRAEGAVSDQANAAAGLAERDDDDDFAIRSAGSSASDGSAASEAEEAATAPTPTASTKVPLGERVFEELSRGPRDGESMEELFERLEAMVDAGRPATKDAPAEDADDARWHAPDEGDLAAFVEEYLWERGHSEHPPSTDHARALRDLVQELARSDLVSVTNLTESALLSSLVQAWARGESQACVAWLEALSAFQEWLSAVQELELDFDSTALRQEIASAADRCQAIEALLTRAGASDDAPRSYHVQRSNAGSWELVSGSKRIDMSCLATLEFKDGDVVLGTAVGDGFAPGVRVLPVLLARRLA